MCAIPTNILYHGTKKENVSLIQNNGILKRERNFAYLSCDYFAAVETGKRYGLPVVLEADMRQMTKDGCLFYRSGSVWLTESVPAKYIKIIG